MLVKTLVNASQNIQDDLFRPTYQGDNALQFSDTNLVKTQISPALTGQQNAELKHL